MPILPEEVSMENVEFVNFARNVQRDTVVSLRRRWMLYQFSKYACNLLGDAAEVGVWRGGTAKIIAGVMAQKDKTTYLFDTFTGLPEPTVGKDNFHKSGTFSDTSPEVVMQCLGELPKNKIVIKKGLFPETAKGLEENRFCFAHIDVDLYKPALEACEFFYPRMTPGGIMIFDDYGFTLCEGVRHAVDEYASSMSIPIIYSATGQAFIIKQG